MSARAERAPRSAERVRAHWRERTQPLGRGANRLTNTTTIVAFRWTVRVRGNANPRRRESAPPGRLAEPRIRSDWDWARCFSNVTGQAPPARQPRRDRGLAPSRIARERSIHPHAPREPHAGGHAGPGTALRPTPGPWTALRPAHMTTGATTGEGLMDTGETPHPEAPRPTTPPFTDRAPWTARWTCRPGDGLRPSPGPRTARRPAHIPTGGEGGLRETATPRWGGAQNARPGDERTGPPRFSPSHRAARATTRGRNAETHTRRPMPRGERRDRDVRL